MTLNKTTVIRSLGWIMVVLIIVLSLIQLPKTPNTIANGDKLLHLVTYFTLTYWFQHAYPGKTLWISLWFIVMGIVLECLQSLTVYRYFEWLDLVMNITGVITAYLLFNNSKYKVKCLLINIPSEDSAKIS